MRIDFAVMLLGEELTQRYGDHVTNNRNTKRVA